MRSFYVIRKSVLWKIGGDRCLLYHCLNRPLSARLYSSLSHGNDTIVVTAGQVYGELQLSSSIPSVSPD